MGEKVIKISASVPVKPLSDTSPIESKASLTGAGAETIVVERKKPGRPLGSMGKKSGSKTRSHSKKTDTEKYAQRLQRDATVETLKGVHDFIALMPGMESMSLSADEAKALLKAYDNWSLYYPNLKLSPKITAWCMLVSTLLVIYAPRGYMIWYTMKERKNAKRVKPVESGSAVAGNG